MYQIGTGMMLVDLLLRLQRLHLLLRLHLRRLHLRLLHLRLLLRLHLHLAGIKANLAVGSRPSAQPASRSGKQRRSRQARAAAIQQLATQQSSPTYSAIVACVLPGRLNMWDPFMASRPA